MLWHGCRYRAVERKRQMAIDIKDVKSLRTIAALEKLSDPLGNIMDVLDKAQKEIGK